MEVDVNDFGIQIRNRRIELGLTQREVADGIGISSADFVSLLEAGRRRLALNRLPRLASVLAVDANDLCRRALQEWQPEFYAAFERRTE